jgi:poly [ADP-ribose] polymerase
MPAVNESTQLRVAKLIMVTASNNNKYYDMEENPDGTFTVKYGRVGATASVSRYPIKKWESKLREKLRKGYKDQTHLFSTKKKETIITGIENTAVSALIADLMSFANKSIETNYNVRADQVSKQQVEEAQDILDQLVNLTQLNLDVDHFNKRLLDLYQVIPRRMGNVREHLLQLIPKDTEGLQEVEEKLAEEQATLDVMRSQVELNKDKDEDQSDSQEVNLLRDLGLEVEEENDPAVIKKIKKLMKDDASRFYRAFAVKNVSTQQSFDGFYKDARYKKTELFWHGSRNENWLSILKTGLVLRPANAVINGKMFGYGLYFADKFKKSLNYTSLRGSYWARGSQDRGYLALFDVHVGKQLKIKKHQPWCYDLSEDNLKARGTYDSLYAKGGADLINNEYIVYNSAQCTIRYLVEVR